MEVHEHRGPDGEITGTTIVRRESVWDDIARSQALALVEWDEGMCGCGCGLPRSEAHVEQMFMVDDETCYAAKAIEQVRRKKREDAERRNLPDGWDDGVHFFARLPTEDEKVVRKRPTRPARDRG